MLLRGLVKNPAVQKYLIVKVFCVNVCCTVKNVIRQCNTAEKNLPTIPRVAFCPSESITFVYSKNLLNSYSDS